MSGTEERARAAMRAIAGTVDDAPPLRLPPARGAVSPDEVRVGPPGAGEPDPSGPLPGAPLPGQPRLGKPLSGNGMRGPGPRRPGGAGCPGGGGRNRRRRSWLAPVAAAAVITALAVALAIIRNAPNGGVAGPPTATPAASASASSGAVPTGVPEYYVAWMQASAPYLVVGNTFTGQRIATVNAPAGVFLEEVFGAAADDRTFVVTGHRLHGAVEGHSAIKGPSAGEGHSAGEGPSAGEGHSADAGTTVWYLLRIAPGSGTPARLTPLPMPARQSYAGVALSPDGTQVAVALSGRPAALRIYSAATGALLREWSTSTPGELMAAKASAGSSWQYTALVLRWSADSRQLAFAWNAAAIRVLDAAAPDGDLIAGSSPLTAIGTTYATLSSFTCQAAHGWQLMTVPKGAAAGRGVVCAGSSQTGHYTACTSPTDTKCAYTQRNFIGFLRVTHDSQGATDQGMDVSSACPSLTDPDNAAYLGWASADGSVIIGSEVCAGHARFGIFSGGGFTPLPALPMSLPVQAGVLEGTFAW
jgi:hypothetical protein